MRGNLHVPFLGGLGLATVPGYPVVEQDHRFIKRLVRPGLGFQSFHTAWRTLKGYEMMNMIRKGQIEGVGKGEIKKQISFIENLFGLAA